MLGSIFSLEYAFLFFTQPGLGGVVVTEFFTFYFSFNYKFHFKTSSYFYHFTTTKLVQYFTEKFILSIILNSSFNEKKKLVKFFAASQQ